MRLLLDDETIEIGDYDLSSMYLAYGDEANVYRLGDEALKIYTENCGKIRLDEETAIKLSSINTKRILLPKRIIRSADDFRFLGYTTTFINRMPTSAIIRMRMPDFISEFDILKEDIELLNDHDVKVADFHLKNMAYNGKIYLIDPGSYVFIKGKDPLQLLRCHNLHTLNEFVRDDLFGMVRLSSREQKCMLNKYNDLDDISEIIGRTSDSGESVRQYVKRMARYR